MRLATSPTAARWSLGAASGEKACLTRPPAPSRRLQAAAAAAAHRRHGHRQHSRHLGCRRRPCRWRPAQRRVAGVARVALPPPASMPALTHPSARNQERQYTCERSVIGAPRETVTGCCSQTLRRCEGGAGAHALRRNRVTLRSQHFDLF